MRRIAFGTFISFCAVVVIQAQAGLDPRLVAQLKQVFPTATSFSPRQADPPHYKAYAGDPKNPDSLLGYAFWTTDLTPLERGYDGPIKVLVGMDPQARLTGIVVAEHHEPYGDFSIDTGGFQAQFRKKDVRDQFKVGADIDAISRATISVTTVSRSVRNSARRIARLLLTPPNGSQ